MKKMIVRILICLMMIFAFSCTVSSDVSAYTEEEKAQAKAWLSAHGYSPDASGAAQAYQDYLDGKFDEELGLIPQITEETPEEETEATTEAPKYPEKKIPGKQKEKATGNKKEKQSDEDAALPGDSSGNSGDSADKQDGNAAESTGTLVADIEPAAGIELKEITDYDGVIINKIAKGRFDWKYEHAVIVIAAGVLAMIFVSVVTEILRNRKKKEKTLLEELDMD